MEDLLDILVLIQLVCYYLYTTHVSRENRREPGIAANSGFTPILTSVSKGGFTGKKKNFAQITAIAFSYIRTEFGASRSMRVGVRSAKQ